MKMNVVVLRAGFGELEASTRLKWELGEDVPDTLKFLQCWLHTCR